MPSCKNTRLRLLSSTCALCYPSKLEQPGLCVQVRIMGSNYIPGEKKDLYNKSVQRTVLCMGRKQDAVEDVPCGNTVALVGLDAFIQKNATLCDQTSTDAFPIKAMKFSVRGATTLLCACMQCNSLELPRTR